MYAYVMRKVIISLANIKRPYLHIRIQNSVLEIKRKLDGHQKLPIREIEPYNTEAVSIKTSDYYLGEKDYPRHVAG